MQIAYMQTLVIYKKRLGNFIPKLLIQVCKENVFKSLF